MPWTKIPLHNQLPDLGVQLLQLSFPDALFRFRVAGEHLRQAVHRLALPFADHRLMHAVLGRQLRRRQLTAQRL